MKEKLKFYATIICVIIVTIFSIILRIPKDEAFYRNCDATYHTLLTMQCYEETPIAIHKFLPIVSLGEKEDKNIPWGSCILDKEGNYYYTSFSPAGFVAPYIFVKVLNLPINIYSLYAFNTIICVATLVLMIIIFCKLFSKYINKNWIILLTTLIYLFSMEVMHSQGVIYWVQSIFQLLIAVQFLLFLNYQNKKARIAFFAMCVLMPYVEWTGYVSNVAFALILFIKDIIDHKKITLKSFIKPIFIGFLTILSFAIFSMHFLMNLDFSDYIYTLKNRFFARNLMVSNVKVKDLIEGYGISYQYMNILCIILLLSILSVKEYRIKLWQLIKEYKYAIIFFSVILLENFIMLEHAVTYTFDRLKYVYLLFIVFYIMLSTFSIASIKDKKMLVNSIAIIVLIISSLNISNYKNGKATYYIVENTYQVNDQLISNYVKEKFDYTNSIICSNGSVRGYLNLLFERGIYELKEYETAKQLMMDKNKRYLVYLETINSNAIGSVTIVDKEENMEYKIHTENNELVVEKTHEIT